MSDRSRPRTASTRAATPVALFLWTVFLLLPFPAVSEAQEHSFGLRFEGEAGREVLSVEGHRGYPALPATAFERLGWSVDRAEHEVILRPAPGVAVVLLEGSPFFRWDEDLLQMVRSPYRFGDDLWVPLQLWTDFLPDRMRDRYALADDGRTLVVSGRVPGASRPARAPREALRPLIVIDPGHGGQDPGAVGPGGEREKDLALAIGLALAEELREHTDFEVRMTRDRDVFVPLWERGARATEWKGERPGVFISIHLNSVDRNSTRGFETYFLSEARTEHERRVAAMENAPLRLEGGGEELLADPELGFILNELRNLDQQHWSSVLADHFQRELAAVLPGPNRGVKQGPLAVITNALMPAVLVEVGFISNRSEARMLTEASRQRNVARAMAGAVASFLERYPPGGEGATR